MGKKKIPKVRQQLPDTLCKCQSLPLARRRRSVHILFGRDKKEIESAVITKAK